jgi:putative membrane protein
MTRFPASVYRRGHDADARFTLANERTFLAWIRTGLALIAGGVALELLGLDLHPLLRLAASLLLIMAGTAIPGLAWIGWCRTERALRADTALPGSALSALLGAVVAVAGALVLLSLVLR